MPPPPLCVYLVLLLLAAEAESTKKIKHKKRRATTTTTKYLSFQPFAKIKCTFFLKFSLILIMYLLFSLLGETAISPQKSHPMLLFCVALGFNLKLHFSPFLRVLL